MKILGHRASSAALCVSFALAGCAQGGSGMGSRTTASLECGLAAAAGTYAICKLAKGNDVVCRNRAILAGTGVALACNLWEAKLKQRQNDLHKQGASLDAQIAYVKGLNDDVARMNADLKTATADSDKRAQALQNLIAQNQASADDIARERKREDTDLATARKQLAEQRAALDDAHTMADKQSPRSSDLDAAITRQTQLLAATQQQIDALAAVRQRV